MLIGNPVTRLFIATLLCLVILMAHIVVRPYPLAISNVAECGTLICICVLSCINLIRAVFSGTMTVPAGPMVSVFDALDSIEFLLVVLIPMIVLAVAVILVVVGLFVAVYDCCRN